VQSGLSCYLNKVTPMLPIPQAEHYSTVMFVCLLQWRPEVFDGASSDEVVAAVKGRKLLGAHRKGKQMWLTLEGDGNKPNLLMHFGEQDCRAGLGPVPHCADST